MRDGLAFLGSLVCVWVLTPVLGAAQTAGVAARPLPDTTALMLEVEAHEKASESVEKDYLYHSYATAQSVDGKGAVKKIDTEESDIFYVAGVRIRRLVKKNGKDLSAGEQKKVAEQIDKEIARAKEHPGEPSQEERDMVTVSRFLELGSFGNARRVTVDGRDTIAVDFTGNPKAKTRTRFEGAIREMEGTVWVDEQDRSLRKLDGRFVRPFKVGAGMLADVKQGSSFAAEWKKVNGEVWLPSLAAGQGDVRVLLLLNFHGSLRAVISDYRKFKATSTIVPVTDAVEAAPAPPQ